MPNDPKWRTIARVSKQPITAVIAVYVHLLVIASNATERGRTHDACSEDLASALDIEIDQIDQILAAMQGRVLEVDVLMGWEKRQVEREDGSAERSKAWRAGKKAEKELENTQNRTQANASERKQTPDKDTDKDTDKDKKSLSGDKDTVDKKTKPAEVCIAMKAAGMQSVNPSNQDLITLLDGGAELPDFVEAARLAVDVGKGFAYALGIVKGKRDDAKRKAEESSKKSTKSMDKHAKHDVIEAI